MLTSSVGYSYIITILSNFQEHFVTNHTVCCHFMSNPTIESIKMAMVSKAIGRSTFKKISSAFISDLTICDI